MQERLDIPSIIKGKTVFAGVGNRMRGDDGVGPCIIDQIKDSCAAICIDVGVAPENYIEKIARIQPDTVVFIDATDFGALAGEVRLFESDNIVGGKLSTHALSLKMACEYLQARKASCKVFLLAIQPQTMNMGEGLSEAVNRAAVKICQLLKPH